MVVILETGQVSDQFVMGEMPYVYSDAIVMWPDEYNSYTPEQIGAMKKARYDRWYQSVTNPLPAVPDMEEPPIDEEA